ncbi:MFS transporter [Paenarthrobacter sp. NPDC089675]|uniref:MFS transporter n=1 Tax=Paenarthrobacter sp. NPDC089675 TaxID=3364376 RepID=UPI00382386F7
MTINAARTGNGAGTSIGARLDTLPVGRMHVKIIVAVGLGLFFEMYEIFLSSTMSVALKTEWGLQGLELQLLLASSFVGMFLGAALLSGMADKLGRRRAFMLNLIWFSVWSLIAAFAQEPWFLVMARFFAGVGLGAEYPVADAYLSDILPKKNRGKLASYAYTCSYLAVPALGFLSLWIAGRTIFEVDGWRCLLALGAIGAVLVMFLRRGIPESPRWLAEQGRHDEAEQALAMFTSGTSSTNPAQQASEEVASVKNPTEPDMEVTDPPAPHSRRRLFQRPYSKRLTMLTIFHLFQTFGYYGFGTMAALVLVSRGYDVTTSLLFVALSFIGYPVGSLISTPLLARFERKYLLAGSIIALAAFGLGFANASDPTLIVVFGFLTTVTGQIYSNTFHIYQAEIFPTSLRVTAVGWTYSLSRLSSAAMPFMLIPVLNQHGAGAMFTIIMVALAIVTASILTMGPRTSNRSLEDINPR